jgi:hypothetical protein
LKFESDARNSACPSEIKGSKVSNLTPLQRQRSSTVTESASSSTSTAISTQNSSQMQQLGSTPSLPCCRCWRSLFQLCHKRETSVSSPSRFTDPGGEIQPFVGWVETGETTIKQKGEPVRHPGTPFRRSTQKEPRKASHTPRERPPPGLIHSDAGPHRTTT